MKSKLRDTQADDRASSGSPIAGVPMTLATGTGTAERSIQESLEDLASLLKGDGAPPKGHIVYHAAPMARCVEQARRFASSSAPVLLTAESGTGKELLAQLIHESSPRANRDYVCVNCAALTDTLIESELFGHEQGAFTGAVARRTGQFELADGGTLLLDEITEMPLHLQAKLLRVLEQEEIRLVGGNHRIPIDVRVIATTNRPLESIVAQGGFRADLYHRLNVLRLELPPLRDRKEDIPALVSYFITQFQHEAVVPIEGICDSACQMLLSQDWPGNIRQLRNAVHRACVINTTGTLEASDFPPVQDPHQERSKDFDDMSLDDIERHVILERLQRFDGNKTAAAANLGVTARTLTNKLKRYRELGLSAAESESS